MEVVEKPEVFHLFSSSWHCQYSSCKLMVPSKTIRMLLPLHVSAVFLPPSVGSEDDEETMETIEEEGVEGASGEPQVFVPGTALKEGEELVHDSSTYHMYHVVSGV